jgi:HEAT repeat protein
VEELQSSSRSRQRRALEITRKLNVASQVEPTLAELARDEDQYLRLEAVRLLATLETTLARDLLRIASHDKSSLVQEAARQGLSDTLAPANSSSDTATFPRGLMDGLQPRDLAVEGHG